ncbi:hypothetical protein KPH14_010550 [Odynerus spinipes]|uniref:Receptor expression-enhancing protein 1 n=1 Tax=Odynerus spinipes TaxID=1348599 RepID=A0AAD9RU57_9HYME|nr:hypothetical protein KPH14_010550 [Odynerus spinipes]
MISSIVSRLVILVFGTLYPAYASYKAVRTQNVKEYVKWMMYWIVFALFTCAETFTDVFFSFWFPFYYEIKIILVLWLLSPATKGSSILYRRFVHPALTRREAEIDEALARATEQGYKAVLHLGTRGVNYATTVLMQTAIKGGGGLVQQLRKSYSLSDLTGGKDVENRSLPEPRDETDMEVEPRRREHVGRRGYSPRRTQSSTNRVEMYFSEVDVDVIQPRPREPIASLTNIRSSDDISSGYSSGEVLQSNRATSQGDALVRTSSVGARTRVKPRSTTKKTPEDTEEESEYDDLLPSPLTFLTPDQARQLFLLLARSDDFQNYSKFKNDEQVLGDVEKRDSKSSSEESDVWFVPDVTPDEEEKHDQHRSKLSETDNISNHSQDRKTSVEAEIVTKTSTVETDPPKDDVKSKENSTKSDVAKGSSVETIDDVDIGKIKDEICREKLDELKELLSNAHKTVSKIVSSEEKVNRIGKFDTEKAQSLGNFEKVDSLNVWSTTNVSRSNSDSAARAGKYNKKPAPKAPVLTDDDDDDDDGGDGDGDGDESEEARSPSAVKATLVIKTGRVKTFSNVDNAKDVFIAHASEAKVKKKRRSRGGISKLLSIPKNIFHGAFHKSSPSGSNRDEDSSLSVSETCSSRSRSVSIGSQGTSSKKDQAMDPDGTRVQKINNVDHANTSSNVNDNTVNDDDDDDIKQKETSDKRDRDVSSENIEDPDAKTTPKKHLSIPQMTRSPVSLWYSGTCQERTDNEFRYSTSQQENQQEEAGMKLTGC